MQRALELAERGRYGVSPNPMVGCVIVRDASVVAEGWHERAGGPHAEIAALAAGADCRGATMYVTLEPCAHHGRTPPCADAIIDAGVSRVVVAMADPDARVDGRGVEMLRAAGIAVDVGVCQSAARRLNEKFVYAATQNLPFVLLKAGMTLDGKLATVARESQWITSDEARERSLALREEYDAIIVGSGTVRNDDPRLTRRLGLSSSIVPWTRAVLDGAGEVPPHAQLLRDGGRTLLFTSRPPLDSGPSVEVIETAERAEIDAVLRELYVRGVRSVVVEGGSVVHSEFIARGLWQKMVLFVAPAFIGGAEAPAIYGGEAIARLTEAVRFRFDRVEFAGRDLMITAYPS